MMIYRLKVAVAALIMLVLFLLVIGIAIGSSGNLIYLSGPMALFSPSIFDGSVFSAPPIVALPELPKKLTIESLASLLVAKGVLTNEQIEGTKK